MVMSNSKLDNIINKDKIMKLAKKEKKLILKVNCYLTI